MKKYIGTTLVFIHTESNILKAIQSSFVIELSNYTDLKKKIKNLVNNLIELDYKNYLFLGVSDLYISEFEGEANFLGRSSFFDCKKLEDAKKHILNNKELKQALEDTMSFDKSNIGLVYFHQDKEGKQYNSTLIIYSQIYRNKNLKDIYNFANSKQFKQKIIDFSIEQLYLDSLNFIGISELYPVRKKGLFSQYAEFENLDEIKSELIPDNELEKAFNDVLEDYKSLSHNIYP